MDLIRWVRFALALAPLSLMDVAPPNAASQRDRASRPRSACEGNRARIPDIVTFRLHHGAFPGSERPDVAVHVPVGFDATRRPGLVVYFHGWQGCAEAALASASLPCADGGPRRPAAHLAAQVDAAGINAIVMAVETRPEAQTGEPGDLAMPGASRDLLREVFTESLSGPLGCALDPDALDPLVVVAHSGGYQAAASLLETGDLARVTQVILLDALYGGEDVFARWVADDASRFDARLAAGLRFVNLYTCCAGTLPPSRAMVGRLRAILGSAGLDGAVYDDDREGPLDPVALRRPVVFKRVAGEHGSLPGTYLRTVLENAGFARVTGP